MFLNAPWGVKRLCANTVRYHQTLNAMEQSRPVVSGIFRSPSVTLFTVQVSIVQTAFICLTPKKTLKKMWRSFRMEWNKNNPTHIQIESIGEKVIKQSENMNMRNEHTTPTYKKKNTCLVDNQFGKKAFCQYHFKFHKNLTVKSYSPLKIKNSIPFHTLALFHTHTHNYKTFHNS